LFERHGFNWRAPGCAGVVDQDVYAAKLCNRLVDDV
jgi:hypothetical protein